MVGRVETAFVAAAEKSVRRADGTTVLLRMRGESESMDGSRGEDDGRRERSGRKGAD
jgi:hypothetical protein